MNKTFTYLGRHCARPVGLTACVLLLHAAPTPASAQLIAANTLRQNAPEPGAPVVEAVSLKGLLRQWEQDHHVTIFYESNVVGDKRVVAQPMVATIEQKLNMVLPQVELQFKKLREDYYVVTSKPAVRATAAADVAVSGRVTQVDGTPVPGATVIVKGSSQGTSTNAEGVFALNVPEGSVLVISSVGYIKQEVTVSGPTTGLNVTLQEDLQALSEVVVVGYGTQSRQELTTSVASVGAKQLERQTVAGFDQALQGQAPGVQVTAPSGAPGAGINVRIRGNNSVSLNNSPLYVIDGVPVLPTYDRELSVGNQKPNPLNTLNPNDIESIDVLKDGAAAAIYGLRASNGVVVITTKRGKVGKPQVSFNAYYGVQSLRKKLDMLNSQQFADFYTEAVRNFNAGVTNPNDLRPIPNFSNLTANTDWQDETYRTAAIQNYQLSVSGGTERTRYYLAGGYFKQEGIILNSGFDRYNFKLNLEQQASDRFRVGTNLNLSRTYNNGSVRSELGLGNSGTVLGALAQIPNIPVRDAVGAYVLNPFTRTDNPVGNLLETSNKAITYQAIGNVYGELDILKNLRFRSSLGLDFRTQLENEFISRNYPGTLNADPAVRGTGRTGNTQQTIWLWENTLTYNPTLGDKHNLTLLAGQSVQESDRFTSNSSVKGYPSNAVPYLSAGIDRTGISSYEEEWGLMSYFARATYSFDERYLATLSLRADGSSRFSDKNKFGYFPAVGLGWRISKESFFPQSKAISELKLRASFGANGNQEFYTYQRFSRYGVGYNYQGTGNAILGGIAPTDLGNEDVKWETTYQYNAGVDLGLLNDRLVLNLDAYRKRTTDLLTSVPIAQSTGLQTLSFIQNVGEVENKGVELGLNTTNVQSENGGFGWSTNLNVSVNRNKVIELGKLRNEQGQEVDREIVGDYSITRKGQALGSFYGYTAQGIFQSTDEITNAPTQPNNPKPGDIRFADINGDGVINDRDRSIIGNPNPKAVAGVTNTFSFKGLELSVFFQGSFGNDIYNQNRQTIEGLSDAVNQTTRVLDRWTPTNTNTDVPRAILGDPNQNNRFSSRFIEDGSYVRLKNLTLGYSLPTGLISKARLSSLRLYVTGQNLLTWTDYSGYDPEVSADPFSSTGFGRDYGVYPQARTYTIGLNASF